MKDSSYLSMTTDEQSFVNLVNYYRDELIQIINGERAATVIDKKCRRTGLQRNGVLLKGGKVTEKAKKVLQDE